VDDRYVGGEPRRHGGAAKVAAADQEVVEDPGVHIAAVRLHMNPPPIAVQQLRPHDPVREPNFCIPAVSLQIPLEVSPDLPSPRQFRGICLPREVAELHRVLALVGEHERVEQPGAVVLAQRP